MNPKSKDAAVVLLSGGLDSTTLLWKLEADGVVCLPLAINYGQRHSKELQHAEAIVKAMSRPSKLQIADLSQLRKILKGSSQTDSQIDVPHGHYADKSMMATVVPNRNMILLSIATAHAIAQGASWVAYAAHAGDHPIYPDCRPDFIAAMAETMQHCHYTPVNLVAPFSKLSKADIVRLGGKLKVPFQLTWSCYAGGKLHCGLCGTCVERQEAFQLGDVPDPTVYADYAETIFT